MKYINHLLLVVGGLSVFLVVKSSNDVLLSNGYGTFFGRFVVGNDIVFNLSSGMLVSIWFYFLVVFLPEYFKKKRIKENFISEYREFRKQIVRHILHNSSEPYSAGLIDELADVRAFKRYFHTKVGDNKNRWYVFSNNLDGKALEEILLEFESLKESVILLLVNIDIKDAEVVSFLHRLKTMSITLKGVREGDYLGCNGFLRLLWEMLSGYTVDGYSDSDTFENILKKI
ncbi:hypothetical protein [Halomonas faecis]|uniref:hypothetical protein n=1 Tax=Halomonas faecis TaxID=1562110 RepID=UPI0013D2AA47|nr:hypothetical protein [Halomonas faecis]